MRADEIQVGKTYEGKRYGNRAITRLVLEIYPCPRRGMMVRYAHPKTSANVTSSAQANFAKWAVREVTDAN